ncbi:gid protein [Mahella australiensis 50-1 BON]|uniref:Methylenetetrahydrofolate--tRNA-(uracil-5-)-methyltransferase TrmFO n=2 Tax=Mahella TaxID=252965 RepID=F4A1K9_MAHA5|nr:methylenetetrahydrofolate--tRNA-(uracil(54)-C(5))-methyltransferase (FADH(2)-oxidizing) TrmFO [Mahella australiensis]AEE96043.1 gid protein [Mahella australiensis 50-1 BON]
MAIVNVIGAGLAGSEAAWQIAQRGIDVNLFEMRPVHMTPAHTTDRFAELVCSNSLRSDRLENAVGLLKEEMRRLNSIIMIAADRCRIPAGGALAVDREGFSSFITDTLCSHPHINVMRREVDDIADDGITVIATGPLTSDVLAQRISAITGRHYLYFYDAVAPIVMYDTIDTNKAFKSSRYGRGNDYINCPMDKEQYERFWSELVNAQTAPLKDFDKQILFEGCMPIEEMARRGKDTLRFGPLKPVGIEVEGYRPYAVVQLRQDNAEGTLYNMVGFQTHLKWGEQQRVFRLIPGLGNAEFVRYGVMHRNTYIHSPHLLLPTYQLRDKPNILFAGQITGVEGYVESASSGLVAGINAALLAVGRKPLVFPADTAIGSLAAYVSMYAGNDFQPMNANFGIMPPLSQRIKNKQQRNQAIAQRALQALEDLISSPEYGIGEGNN